MEISFSIFVRSIDVVVSSSSCIVGAGEVISERDRCPQCKGNKITQEKKVLEVHVEKGMQQGEKIVFEGQADEAVSRNYYFFGLGFVVYNLVYITMLILSKDCEKLIILVSFMVVC